MSGSSDQRYYASSYGRFLTPDKKARETEQSGKPQSVRLRRRRCRQRERCAQNVYGYDFPGSLWDQERIRCADSEANSCGADTAYPYQGQGTVNSRVTVGTLPLFQGADPATVAAYAAILYAQSNTNGPVDIVAYSGGAEAFAAAYQLLTPAQQADIGRIIYIAPGSAGAALPVNTGQTYAYTGPGFQNAIAGAGTYPCQCLTPTNCYHRQLSCWFGAAAGPSATVTANGVCTDPQSFTRDQADGWLAAATAASQQQQIASMWSGIEDSMAGMASSFLDSLDSIPVGGYQEQVSSTITFDWP